MCDQKSDNLVRLGEAARQVGLTTQQVQYYLYMGVVSPTTMSDGNQRLFDQRAIKRIRMVHLLNQSGYPLREIRDIFMKNSSE